MVSEFLLVNSFIGLVLCDLRIEVWLVKIGDLDFSFASVFVNLTN